MREVIIDGNVYVKKKHTPSWRHICTCKAECVAQCKCRRDRTIETCGYCIHGKVHGANITATCPKCKGTGYITRSIKFDFSLAYSAIQRVKEMYPESMFPKNGEGLDCKSAEMARLTCDNIRRELDGLITEQQLKNIENEKIN